MSVWVNNNGTAERRDGGIALPIDSVLSNASENPVQNKVIKQALDGKQDTLTMSTVPTTNSNNPITSGGVKDYAPFKFGINLNNQYGYYKEGENTVTPFGDQSKNLSQSLTINGDTKNTVEDALGTLADTTFTREGLTFVKCQYNAYHGGYKFIGKGTVLVNMNIKITEELTNAYFTELIYGLPFKYYQTDNTQYFGIASNGSTFYPVLVLMHNFEHSNGGLGIQFNGQTIAADTNIDIFIVYSL